MWVVASRFGWCFLQPSRRIQEQGPRPLHRWSSALGPVNGYHEGMVRRAFLAPLLVFLALAVGATGWAVEPTHRVWILDGQVDGLDELILAGIDGLVLPVGDVEVGEDSSRLTLRPPRLSRSVR